MTSWSLCREDFLTRLERVVAAGPTGVILREKDLPPEDYRAPVGRALTLCRARGVPCILHSLPKAVEALGERAIHLPLSLPRALPLERRGASRVLGTFCHSVEDAREAEKPGCTHITASHVFATDCKKGLVPRGLDLLRVAYHAMGLPMRAIGGITPESFPSVRAAGARGGRVMNGLMVCADSAALLERFARRN